MTLDGLEIIAMNEICDLLDGLSSSQLSNRRVSALEKVNKDDPKLRRKMKLVSHVLWQAIREARTSVNVSGVE